MSVIVIKATIECDGCGSQFRVEIDAAERPGPNVSWHDAVEAIVQGGNVAESLRGDGIGFTSLQGGKLLCPQCTSRVDDEMSDDREATEAEVNSILGL